MRCPPSSTLFPYTTLFRSHPVIQIDIRMTGRAVQRGVASCEAGSGMARRIGFSDVRFDFNDGDRKSTRLNSSHANISYAVFCLKKKNRMQAHRFMQKANLA